MKRLHIDDFKDRNCKYPVGQAIEGLTTCFYSIKADKIYSILNKICPLFIVIGYIFYFFEDYEPFKWSPYGTFVTFNFVDEPKNYIKCKNITLTGWETPSILRMSVLKSFPSVFLRASILPLLFGRLFFLTLCISKWRRCRKDKKYEFIDTLSLAVSTVEILSLGVFSATTSHYDSLYHHQTFGVTFIILAIISFCLITFISKDIDPSIQYPLMFYTVIFTISTPIVMINYFIYQSNKTCSPLVYPQYTVLEVLSILSYILFYWKSNNLIKNIDLVVFSSKTEITDVDSILYKDEFDLNKNNKI